MANIRTSKRFMDNRTSSIPTLALILFVRAAEFGTIDTDFVGLKKYPISDSKAKKEYYI
jgi:hypothetical protein